jgi:hypothetical protein
MESFAIITPHKSVERLFIYNTFVAVSVNCSVVIKLLVDDVIDHIVRNDSGIPHVVCDFAFAAAKLVDCRQRLYRHTL